MDVAAWLKNLGLGQYEAAFRDGAIDEDVLPRLTAEDLKDVGVTIVGHRRKLLDAIAALGGASQPAAPPAPVASSPRQRRSGADAERRPITVMFCDLVGSTALASRLDAEDWRSLVNSYLEEASTAVTGLGGHVLKRLGDGLMALFGYPSAQENDAERAVRAALAIQRALADLNVRNAPKGSPELVARIGLDSGPVVIDATGEPFGEAPNLAARVQAAAEPGTVLVTAAVQRQVAGLFVAEDRGAHALKGAPAPVTLYRIVRASGGRRFGGRALTPLVGREEELDLLRRRWQRSVRGEGQLALVVGEPGIGKSRLIEEFRATLGETPHTFVEWSSSQLLQNTPLHPVAEWGRQRFGADEPAARRLADLENTLRLIGLDISEFAPLLAPLVDIPLPEERAAKLAPEELRRRQLAALVAWYLAGARTQPVVLAFEDLHWADPTSLDLMQTLVERGANAPLFIIATARPEFRPPWGLRSHHSVISLRPLDRADVAQMVGELGARYALSKEVVEGVSERTGGVPLFVEEVTRLLLERGEAGGLQAIPPTLQQSLAARLDRLGDAREVAQIGAVLGRDFTYSLLSTVGGIDHTALQSALDRLAGADLLIAEGAGHESKYRFKHALIQDAAYDSLLKSRRQALHRRAAEVLRDSAESAAAPEVLAHHFTQAGLDDLAIEWWGKAGDQALRRSAFQEAIAHLGKAIAMADKGDGGLGQGKKLHVAYGNALIAARGYGAPETEGAFARARELASSGKDPAERLGADFGLWVGNYVRGDLTAMRNHAETFLGDVEANPDSPEGAVAQRVAGTTHWFAGEYAAARWRLERALALFQPGRDDDLAFRFGQDVGVSAMLWLALTLWPLGDIGRALSLVDEAEARIAGLAHVGTRAFVMFHTAMFELVRGNLSRATPYAAELARLSRQHDLSLWRAFAVFLEGLTVSHSNAANGGLETMRRGIDLLREQNVLVFDGLFKIALAEAEARAGDDERAVAILDEALASSERTGNRAFDAETQRARGEMLLKRDPSNAALAEEAFQTAIAVAKQQGTRSFELRAALSLAKLYQSTARPVEAHGVLAPALEGFAPTPEMPEIAEAQALLAALGETEEVQIEEARGRQRLHLQTAYGQAAMWSKGFSAEETKAAFARAAELAARTDRLLERFAALQGQWAGACTRGELHSVREQARAFFRDAEDAGQVEEAGITNFWLGLVAYWHGDFVEARTHYEGGLAARSASLDPKVRDGFGDARTWASAIFAVIVWQLGEVQRARELIDWATQRASEINHIGATADVLFWKSYLEVWRGDPVATLSAAGALERVAREHGMTQYLAEAELHSGWARGRIDDPTAGAAQVRRVLVSFVEQGVRVNLGFYTGLLAELEAETSGAESALAHIDEAFRLSNAVEHRCSLPFLHRLRGDILLKRDPADPAPAAEAFRSSIAIAKEQGARSPVLLASLPLAKLYQSSGRLAEAHAVLALALEGFAPTPEMPEIAEARTVLAVLAETDEVKNDEARRRQRLHLQTSYGQAMMWAKGFAAEETKAAFSRAAELAANTDGFAERFAAAHFQWTLDYLRGELRSARALESSFLEEAEDTGRVIEAGVARRGLALACYQAGDFQEARVHCERALEACELDYDRETQERFHDATGPIAMSVLAVTMWQLGEVGRARELIDQAVRRGKELNHAPSMTHPYLWKSHLEILRGDAAAALAAAEALADLGLEGAMPFWRTLAQTIAGWARGRLYDAEQGVADLRRALAERADQDARSGNETWLYTALLAELEAETLGVDAALARIDEALALARRVENRCNRALPDFLRGEFLLKRDPSSPAAAEAAFQSAIAVAREQGARSWGLRAALALAKLYQSAARPADARAVLAPALEGFSPTPEMPEIGEAQAVLAVLAETEEVKVAEAQRQRRLHLQTAYGQAMMWSKGFAAEETKAAFARAAELAANTDNFAARFATAHSQWASATARGEQWRVRELASSLLKEAEEAGRPVEAGVARRGLALACYLSGEFLEARIHCERALDICDPERERETRERFTEDTGPIATSVLAMTMWQLGKVERARVLIDEANRHANGLGHAPSMAHPLIWKSRLEILRGDAAAALSAAEDLEALCKEYGMPYWRVAAELNVSWARGRLHDAAAGADDLRRALAAAADKGMVGDAWFSTALLAELEAETLGADSALKRIDEALALAQKVDNRCDLAFLCVLRGKLLLERDPSKPAAVEEAFQTALKIAKQQGARSWGLRAALSLAKLYQSTNRVTDAYATLAPALEGFSPTPEMPEIAEAISLIERLA